MSDIDHSVGRALVEGLAALNKTPDTSDRTTGEVTKVGDDGIIWVRFARASESTPCVKSTVTAKVGDTVSIRIENSRGVVDGNLTSPAGNNDGLEQVKKDLSSVSQTADMARSAAESALSDAQATHEAAQSAAKDAAIARESAASARKDADSAAISAEEAAHSADLADQAAKDAIGSAEDAYLAALGALTSLGTVEDVMGTLDMLNRDKSFVKCPEGSVISEDVTYWVKVPVESESGEVTYKFVPVENPSVEDIGDYYVVDVNLMLANLVESKLTVTDKGLYITPSKIALDDGGNVLKDAEGNVDMEGDPSGYLLLTETGMTVFDKRGTPVATYGGEIGLGNENVGTSTSITTDVLRLIRNRYFGTESAEKLTVFETGSKIIETGGTGDDYPASFLQFGQFPNGSKNYLISAIMPDDGTKAIVKIGDKSGDFPTGVNLYGEVGVNGELLTWPLPVGMGGTGAREKVAALNNLQAKSLGHGTLIPENADLNDYKTPGNFYNNYSDKVAKFSNCPTKYAMFMEVSYAIGQPNSDYIRQTIYDRVGETYTRIFHSASGWLAWRHVYDSSHVIPLTNGGTGATSADGINSVLFKENAAIGGVFGWKAGTGWTGAYRSLTNLRSDMSVPSMTKDSEGYWGIGSPDGSTGGYLRTPQNGIIPMVKNNANTTYVGTVGWPFSQVHTKRLYGQVFAPSVASSWLNSGAKPENSAIHISTKLDTSSAWPIVNAACSDSSHIVMLAYDKSFRFGIINNGQTANILNNEFKFDMADGKLTCQKIYSNEIDGTHKGTWNGNVIGKAYGGSGSSIYWPVTSLSSTASQLVTQLAFKTTNGNYLEVCVNNSSYYGVNLWNSDARLKSNISDSCVSGLSKINSIRHREFEMRGSHYSIGYVAQEIEQVMPESVLKVPQYRTIDEQAIWTGDYTYQIDERGLIPYMTKSIQELSAKCDEQETRIAKLENELAQIKSMLKGAADD